MSIQHHANIALREWQRLKPAYPEPIDRIQALVSDFFAPLPPSDIEYEITLRDISEIMAHA